MELSGAFDLRLLLIAGSDDEDRDNRNGAAQFFCRSSWMSPMPCAIPIMLQNQ